MAFQKSQVGRASAVLTTAEVAGATFSLRKAKDAVVNVDFSFTIGSLTNVIVYFYASMDGTNFDAITTNGAVYTETITASAERCFVLPSLNGYKFARVSVKGTGTVTSSLCDFTYRYNALWSA